MRTAEGGERLRPGRDAIGPETPCREHVDEDAAARRAVVHDQDPEAAQRRGVEPVVAGAVLGRPVEAYGEVEAAAAPGHALDPDAAAHELDQLGSDRESEARAAVAPGHRAAPPRPSRSPGCRSGARSATGQRA